MVSELGRSRNGFRQTSRMNTPSMPSLVPPPTPGGWLPSQSSSSGPRASFGAACLANFGKGSENQDTYVTSTSGSKSFVGVFDGHGERGGKMSEFAKSTLTRSLFANRDLHSDPKAALAEAYRNTQQLMESKHGPEALWSGTTAVSAYQHRDRLFVANVGDSRAVLGRCETARPGVKPRLVAVDLSSDQKPDRPDERQRVTALGGIVQQGQFPVLSPMGLRFIRAGPERVMDKNGMGGLAMSRSFGDLSLRPYVSSQPEIHERQLCGKDRLLVLGTDGVWDHVSSQEAVEIAGKHRDPQAAAREITSVAKRRWNEDTQGQMSDDITAVVVNLDHSEESRRPESGPMNNTSQQSARSTAKSWRTKGDIESASITLPAAPPNGMRRNASTPAMRSIQAAARGGKTRPDRQAEASRSSVSLPRAVRAR